MRLLSLDRAPLRLALLVALLTGLRAAPVAGQVQGVVVDASRRPVAGALVELWVAQQRTAATETGPEGAFKIGPAVLRGGATLSVRRLGMRTQTFDLTAADTVLLIQMEAQPVALAPLIVESPARRVCPNREDPGARALWERMRSRYWQESMDTLLVFALIEFRSGVGQRTEVDGLRTSAGWTHAAISGSGSRYLSRTGYAIRVAGSAGERYASWQYRSLDDGAKQDFTQPYFGSQHTFSIIHAGAGRTVLGFCPRDRLGQTGQLYGTLVLGPDGTLVQARWNFRTREPSEDAGGEATYFPPDPQTGSALLAGETSFWRKNTSGEYYIENRTYTGWRLWDKAATRPGQGRP